MAATVDSALPPATATTVPTESLTEAGETDAKAEGTTQANQMADGIFRQADHPTGADAMTSHHGTSNADPNYNSAGNNKAHE